MSMNKKMIQSLIIFLLMTGVIFYGAHLFAEDSEVSFSTENARSTTFLNLVEVLRGIEFDLAFVDSLTPSPAGFQRPVFVREVFDGRTGRANPFAPASARNSFSIVSPGGGIPGGFPDSVPGGFPEPSGTPDDGVTGGSDAGRAEIPAVPPSEDQTLTLP